MFPWQMELCTDYVIFKNTVILTGFFVCGIGPLNPIAKLGDVIEIIS